MATTVKGPAIFLAQFAGDSAPSRNAKVLRRAEVCNHEGAMLRAGREPSQSLL